MPDFRRVTDRFSVAPQIQPADLAAAAAEGYTLIINNRPDGEDPGQPSAAAMAVQAATLGLTYVHIPVQGGPSLEQAIALTRAIEDHPGRTLAYCRSGTRSINTWALGRREAHLTETAELLRLGSAAGYDLSGVLRA